MPRFSPRNPADGRADVKGRRPRDLDRCSGGAGFPDGRAASDG